MEVILSPQRFKEYLVELKTNIPEIQRVFVLVDPSEVANFVKEELKYEEIAVFGVLPDVNSESINEDSLTFVNTLGLRIVEKCDYKSYSNQDEWLLVYQRTSEIVKEIIYQLVEDSTNPAFCDILGLIESDSYLIRPVWREADVNGWDIEFQTKLS